MEILSFSLLLICVIFGQTFGEEDLPEYSEYLRRLDLSNTTQTPSTSASVADKEWTAIVHFPTIPTFCQNFTFTEDPKTPLVVRFACYGFFFLWLLIVISLILHQIQQVYCIRNFILCGNKRSNSESDIEAGNGRSNNISNNGYERVDKEEFSRMLPIGSDSKSIYPPLTFVSDHQPVPFK
jgi:hypothetical protein